jgi:hypothetical protein
MSVMGEPTRVSNMLIFVISPQTVALFVIGTQISHRIAAEASHDWYRTPINHELRGGSRIKAYNAEAVRIQT